MGLIQKHQLIVTLHAELVSRVWVRFLVRADLRHAVELFNHIYLGQEASPAASVCFNMSLKMVGIVGEFEMTTNSCLLSPSTTCFFTFLFTHVSIRVTDCIHCLLVYVRFVYNWCFWDIAYIASIYLCMCRWPYWCFSVHMRQELSSLPCSCCNMAASAQSHAACCCAPLTHTALLISCLMLLIGLPLLH